jgi:hypothetical protein
MYVVIWEPKHGHGGGHQLALDREKADTISRTLSRAMPDVAIRIEHADAYAAAAVMEPRQQRQYVPHGASQRRPERSGQRTWQMSE